MSEAPDELERTLATLSELAKYYHQAVQLARQAILDALHERGYSDAQIAAMARRRPRTRRRELG